MLLNLQIQSKMAHSRPDFAALNVLMVQHLSTIKNNIFINSEDNFNF